jgi:plastocyanin
MRRVVTIGLVALVSACSGEASTTTTLGPEVSTTIPSPTTTILGDATTTEPPAAPDTTIEGPTADIAISGFSFGSQQTVAAGTTVIATNNDPFTHTWTSADGIWDSGNLSQGESFAFTFQEPGTYSFFCKVHPTEMGGSIVIEG